MQEIYNKKSEYEKYLKTPSEFQTPPDKLTEDETKMLNEYERQRSNPVSIKTDPEYSASKERMKGFLGNLLQNNKNTNSTKSDVQVIENASQNKLDDKRIQNLGALMSNRGPLPPINRENIGTTVNDDSNVVRITKISDNKYKTNINDKEKGNVTNIVNISETNDNKITVEIEEPESLIGKSPKMNKLLLNQIKEFTTPRRVGGKKSKKRQIKYKRNTKKSQK
jgi:hypothetical protein